MRLHKLFSDCLSAPYRDAGSDVSYAIDMQGRTLYIFFEHSQGLEDWKVNLNFPAAAYEREGKISWYAHRGFLGAWRATEAIVSSAVSHSHADKIVIVGYSHGGAIAMLCHEYIWYNFPVFRERIEGFGFGAPRVFWGIKSRELSQRWKDFTVIRNIDDLVTHLPPSAVGYSHMGKLMEIGERGKYSAIDAHRAENIAKELEGR